MGSKVFKQNALIVIVSTLCSSVLMHFFEDTHILSMLGGRSHVVPFASSSSVFQMYETCS